MTVYTEGRSEHEQRWLSPDQTASYLTISRSTCYKLLASGEIPSRRFGRQIRVDKAALDAAEAHREPA